MNGGLSEMWTPLAATRAEAVARLAAERQAADLAVAELLALPPAERRRRIRDEARFRTVAVAALGRLTQAVLALVRTLETDPVAMED